MLITIANSLDPDQAQQNVGPDLDPICLKTLTVFLKDFFEKVNFEKISCQHRVKRSFLYVLVSSAVDFVCCSCKFLSYLTQIREHPNVIKK